VISTATPVPATTIDRIVDGMYPAMALLAGMQLDVFTTIARGRRTAAEIAGATGGDVNNTRLLLDALVAAGLLGKSMGEYLLGEEAADHLVAESPWSRVDVHHGLAALWEAALRTADSVRTGRAAHPHRLAAMGPTEVTQCLGGLDCGAAELARRCLPVLRLADGDRVLDIGGGGGEAVVFAEVVGGRGKVTVLELRSTAPVGRALLDERSAAEITVVSGDATVEVPGPYDVVWSAFVMQTLPPDEAEALIANGAQALEANGSLHLLNVVVDTPRTVPARAALFNIALLNLYAGGQAYTIADYERWLRAVGFGSITWTPINDMVRLVSARRRS
jgi:protein-L-isoaspartate O-methyltransferase